MSCIYKGKENHVSPKQKQKMVTHNRPLKFIEKSKGITHNELLKMGTTQCIYQFTMVKLITNFWSNSMIHSNCGLYSIRVGSKPQLFFLLFSCVWVLDPWAKDINVKMAKSKSKYLTPVVILMLKSITTIKVSSTNQSVTRIKPDLRHQN